MDATETSLPKLPPRQTDAHKGDFGLALIVGGSRGMAGAVALAGMAALRGGAGLVRLAVPELLLDTVAAFEPSYMTIPLRADAAGRICAGPLDRIADLAEKAHYQADHLLRSAMDSIVEWAAQATAVACGPGLGRSKGLDEMVVRLYREIPQPMIFDADALNALATDPSSLAHPGGPRILTPHPGEFARLVGKKLELDARNAAAVQLAARCKIVVVLKGHRTLVTDGQRHAFNTTGNPGMATGGSGDVLTGLITALVCQKMEPFDAARLGVYLHGLAGDLASQQMGQVSLIASDLIRYLPKTFQVFQAAQAAAAHAT
ncbi:MAG: NAD(P)H-hydrate dehydratase [Planctomycetaceae bacterium]|nr:NAD(P)H-hydrate dehydratase [Planctomycetaceae bacterium]